ncbi:MAG: aldo/keto reductase [Lentisphaerae bacterium]|nr:aldo/keto reductase [Lentisphaerota bacterium]
MSEMKSNLNRRSFLKSAGLAGAALAAAGGTRAETPVARASAAPAPVPTRKFGRSGLDISMLGMGGMFDIPNNQIVLRQALAMGVTYWDTADCYEGGRSEEGVGKFFARNPGTRDQVFLLTKSDARDPAGASKLLDRSLERMKTDHIDLYLIHNVKDLASFNDDLRAWAEQAKAAGKIRLFGFSTHGNMAGCLADAAPLSWIDGILLKYDFRLMQQPDMTKAVDACVKAGIGLIAMKTQGGRVEKGETAAEAAMAQSFLARGFSDKQANLKAVWEDQRISSIVSQMPNVAILQANVAAALDKTELTASDRQLMNAYAESTSGAYCAGCTHLCESVCPGAPIGDGMRALMYHRDYGDHTLARNTWHGLPEVARKALTQGDLASAERVCPQGLPIARLMRDAAELLA